MARIAVVAGDGIGTEVVAQGLKVLDAVLPGCETTAYDLGAARYNRTGEVLPESVLAELAATYAPAARAARKGALQRRRCRFLEAIGEIEIFGRAPHQPFAGHRH